MNKIELPYENFLNHIVSIKEFQLTKNSAQLIVLCIENKGIEEVCYSIELNGILYYYFSQLSGNFAEDFDVIDAFLGQYNSDEIKAPNQSEETSNSWLLRFHSGLHHIHIGFNEIIIKEISREKGQIDA